MVTTESHPHSVYITQARLDPCSLGPKRAPYHPIAPFGTSRICQKK